LAVSFLLAITTLLSLVPHDRLFRKSGDVRKPPWRVGPEAAPLKPFSLRGQRTSLLSESTDMLL
jgi:hypothetical protein